jgi:hypothetical protein
MGGYLQEADRWLDVIFTDLADGKMTYAEVKRDIRERILDSYRNGLKAARQKPLPRDPERPRVSRRERYPR